MALLKILTYPNPKLRKKSAPVGSVDSAVLTLLDNMLETMRSASGIGLSAPQVGNNIRVALVSDARGFETQAKEEPGNSEENKPVRMPVIEMINPVITCSSGSSVDSEGCLSIPDFSAKVRRKKTVEVEWLCRRGEKNHMTADGLTARIIQHETDHLDGVLFVDRLSALKREMMLKKMDKVFGDGSPRKR